MLRDGNPFGGTLIHILFIDHADKVFIALVYPEDEARNLTLQWFSPADFSDEDIQRVRVRYKKLIEGKTHAM
jgi:hypothetical protein